MPICYEEKSRTFHLRNRFLSYIMKILPDGRIGQLYFGKAVRHKESFDYLFETAVRTFTAVPSEEVPSFSPEHLLQEFPCAGTGDFRQPAVEVLQANGSRISAFGYEGHSIEDGKPALEGLPATYCESDAEACTLCIRLRDPLTGIRCGLYYTVFEDVPAVARSVRFENAGREAVWLNTAMSLSLDLPDADYDMLQLSGAWGRERFPFRSRLRPGIQRIESLRGHSSHQHNPFLALVRPRTDERQGEAIGISLIYSGNFLAQAERNCWDVTRISIGIHPGTFCWKLHPGETFQTPEAVLIYADAGLNAMSQAFHRLFRTRLCRGYWRDRPRPVLLNNWEATAWNFTQEELLHIAGRGAAAGVELFVLDDGWSRNRRDDRAGLGDWSPDPAKLPEGLGSFSRKLKALGLSFGIWFEPEMLNLDSDLYRSHPDWVLRTPGRAMSSGRHEYVLDYSRPEVVDELFSRIRAVLSEGGISYVKWDMNRSITEAFSAALPPDRQGELYHRYILGVYALYARLTETFPEILFESCASGGGRFDPGLLYYAPQGWASDCSDAVQRIRIQYGTSLCYPISSIGAHVSKSPNLQLNRCTPLATRANVALFGAFGYEMDPGELSDEEFAQVRRQIRFAKKYRRLLQFGTFYRLRSPFEGNYAAWMSISDDQRTAIVGWFKFLNEVNAPYRRIRLEGLSPDLEYQVREIRFDAGRTAGDCARVHGGDELMRIGLLTTDSSAGECQPGQTPSCDFASRLFLLTSR